MTEINNTPDNKEKYSVITVEKIQPPEGMPEGKWHRYVIGRGHAKIEGTKPGTLKSVTEHAETVANDLNSRAQKGGSYFAPSNRQNKKE